MHRDFAAGSQGIERAHMQAQAQMQDRIIEDQAIVIANLWRVLAWAGIPPQQVSPAVRHGGMAPSRAGQQVKCMADIPLSQLDQIAADGTSSWLRASPGLLLN